jgi:hypothetical protein
VFCLKDFNVVCQDHWLQYKLCYRTARVIWWQLCDLEPPFQSCNCPVSTVIWATNQPWNGFWTFNIRHSVLLGRQRTTNSKALRVSGDWGSQISRQPAHKGGKFVSLTHRPPLTPPPPRNIPCTHFYWRLSQPQGHSAAGRIMSVKNSSDIRNRTCDLRACSAVPKPIVPPCALKQILNAKCSRCPIVYTSELFSKQRSANPNYSSTVCMELPHDVTFQNRVMCRKYSLNMSPHSNRQSNKSFREVIYRCNGSTKPVYSWYIAADIRSWSRVLLLK